MDVPHKFSCRCAKWILPCQRIAYNVKEHDGVQHQPCRGPWTELGAQCLQCRTGEQFQCHTCKFIHEAMYDGWCLCSYRISRRSHTKSNAAVPTQASIMQKGIITSHSLYTNRFLGSALTEWQWLWTTGTCDLHPGQQWRSFTLQYCPLHMELTFRANFE